MTSVTPAAYTQRVPPPRFRVPSYPRYSVELAPRPGAPEPSDPAAVREWVQRTPRPHAVELFCGAGGLSLGLEQAGFRVVAAADQDPIALETHAANIGAPTWAGDLGNPDLFLRTLEAWGIGHAELLAGGPPCQPFSRAGLAKINSLVKRSEPGQSDSRRGLWRSFFSVVDALRPDAVLFENVSDFTKADDGGLVVQFLVELRRRGYQADARLLPAWKFGVPQHRLRLFAIGWRSSTNFPWPGSNRRVTLGAAIGDLPAIPPGQLDRRIRYLGRPTKSFAREMRSGLDHAERKFITDHVTRYVRPDDAEAYTVLKPGNTYRDVPKHLRRYREDIFTDKYYRLRADDLSRSITAHIAKDGYWYIHPTQDRTLSVREAARVQSFPDRFRFAGTLMHQYRQIGNAVPPRMAKAVGQAVLHVIDPAQAPSQPAEASAPTLRSNLLKWHRANDRPFAWRSLRAPWPILLAEMCLQRTHAPQVAAIFSSLLEVASTPDQTIANEADVRRLTSTLGLRWRVDAIMLAASAVVERFAGVLPADWQSLRSLPGVGDYVASAVSSFAFGRPAVLLDTNTRRIAMRLAGTKAQSALDARLLLYRTAGPSGPDPEFNYSLLDLGARICVPRAPKCDVCPISRWCRTAPPHS